MTNPTQRKPHAGGRGADAIAEHRALYGKDEVMRNGRQAPALVPMAVPQLTGNRCQCPTCLDYFGSVRGFDRHRIGTVGTLDRRCMTEAEMLAAGWHRNARSFLLTPDPRRAGAGTRSPRATPPATGVQGAKRGGINA